MIQIIGPPLSQWDTGRSIEASGSTATHAHFANRGDSYAVIMELVDGKTKIPDYLLRTGKDLCVYLVLDRVTQESKTFSVRKREKPVDYVYEDDQRNYIYKLIEDAKAATNAANQVAQDLLESKGNGDFSGKDGKSIHFINDSPVVTPTGFFSVETFVIPTAQIDDLVLFSDTTLGIVIDISENNVFGRVIAILKGEDGEPADLSNYYTKEEFNQLAEKLVNDLPSLGLATETYVGEYVDEKIGAISTALDSIIAMQEELIGESGGMKTITFTVEFDNNVYTANEGMDWYDWVESEYNTTGFYIDNHFVRHESDDALGLNGETISPRDYVIADAVYQRL